MHDSENNTLSVALVSLLRGVATRDDNESVWYAVLHNEARVRDYVRLLGLELVVMLEDGYAFLRQVEDTEDGAAGATSGNAAIPRLLARRPLSYPVSLVLALLRRRLAEHDASSGEARLIIDVEEMVETMRTFLPEASTETRLTDQINGYLRKVAELGFIRYIDRDGKKFEVRRLIKAFIDAQWLAELEERLRTWGTESGTVHATADAETEREDAE